MSKFVNSNECIDQKQLLWEHRDTQVGILNTYELRVFPKTNLFNESSAIDFSIPPQPKGQLTDLDIVTKFKVTKADGAALDAKTNCSVVSNIANCLWSLVDVFIDNRTNLMQSMKQSYAFHSFISTILNSSTDHADFLYATQFFLLDDAKTKTQANSTTFYPATEGDELDNYAGSSRAERIAGSASITVKSKIHCPLFNSNKSLPTNLPIRISLTRNDDKFILLAAAASTFKLVIENIYLNVTYIRPRDDMLLVLEEKLRIKPATYFTQNPEVSIRTVPGGQKNVIFTDLFHRLPKYVVFMLQKASELEGSYESNPLTFYPFGKANFFVNDQPIFSSVLTIPHTASGGHNYYLENALIFEQLYKTIGRSVKSNCLITRNNFQIHFMLALSLTPDKAHTQVGHLNLVEKATTRFELDWDLTTLPTDMVLIAVAFYDRQIQINVDREVTIIE